VRACIITGNDGWHVRDLQRAAAQTGIEVSTAAFQTLHACLGDIAAPDAQVRVAVVRTMPAGSLEQVVFRMDVLHHWQKRGVLVCNPPRALETCVDKYLAGVRLQEAGVPVPPTWVGQKAAQALDAFEQLGGDVVVKPLFGSEGRGMMRVSHRELAGRVFRTLEQMGAVMYVQSFLRHPGWDLRLFVIDQQVVAAMKRYAAPGQWRTNIAQGGHAEPFQPDGYLRDLAVRAARAVGAFVCGVDILLHQHTYFVLEVNAVPGWRALARVCQVDIAARLWTGIRQQLSQGMSVDGVEHGHGHGRVPGMSVGSDGTQTG